jgi:putative addiction module component (TIGR02574 family)
MSTAVKRSSKVRPATRRAADRELSVAERILQVQALWDEISAHPESVELTEAQGRELDRRAAAHRASPNDVRPWDEVRRRVRGDR